MRAKATRFPSILAILRDESGLTYEQLASQLEVTVGCVMKWRNQGHTVEHVVLLLRFASDRNLKCAFKLMSYLQEACGHGVTIVRSRTAANYAKTIARTTKSTARRRAGLHQ